MAYTLASGASARKGVEVQVLSAAQVFSGAWYSGITHDSGSCNPSSILGAPTMKITIEKIKENPTSLLRRAGYIFQRNEGNEMSFIRPLARAGFPRFHMYASAAGTDLVINIHLDQKKETYGNSARHHGEYEDEGALKAEVKRIKAITK